MLPDVVTSELVRVADRFEIALLDPQLRRHLGIVATHLLDEPLRILAPDEHLELDAEREVRREGVIDDGVEDHGDRFTRRAHGAELSDTSQRV